jgi:hypothetical protein
MRLIGLLLLSTYFLLEVETIHESVDFFDSVLRAHVKMLTEFLHESKVLPHLVSKSCQLAQFWDQDDIPRVSHVLVFLAWLAANQWLLQVLDFFVVALSVVVSVRNFSLLGLERVQGRSLEVNVLNVIGLPVVRSHNNSVLKLTLDFCLWITATRIPPDLTHELIHVVETKDLVCSLDA